MLPLVTYGIFFLVLVAAISVFWVSAWDTELIMSHTRIPDDQMFEDPKEFSPTGPLATILIKKFALNSTIMKSMNERKKAISREEHILVNLSSNSDARMILWDENGVTEESRLGLIVINRTWDFGDQPNDRFRISYENWRTAIEIYSRDIIPMVSEHDSVYWFLSSYQVIEEDWTYHSSLWLPGFVEKLVLSEDRTMLAVVTLYQKLHGSEPRNFRLEQTRAITLYRVINFELEVIWKKELPKPSAEVTALVISRCFVLYSLRNDIFAFRHIPIRFPYAQPQDFKQYPIARQSGFVHNTQLLLMLDVPDDFSRGFGSGFCHKGAFQSECDTVLVAKIIQDNKLFMPTTTVYTTQCPVPEDKNHEVDFAKLHDIHQEADSSAGKKIDETESTDSDISVKVEKKSVEEDFVDIMRMEGNSSGLSQFTQRKDNGECIALDLFLDSWEAVKHSDLYQEVIGSDVKLYIKGVHHNGRAALGISKYVSFLNATDDGESYWTDEGDSSTKTWEHIAMLGNLVVLMDNRGKLLVFNEWYNYEVTYLPDDFEGLRIMDLQLLAYEDKTFALIMLEKGVLACIDITSTYEDISGSYEAPEVVMIIIVAALLMYFLGSWCVQRRMTRSAANRVSTGSSRERQSIPRTISQTTTEERGVLSGTSTYLSRNTVDPVTSSISNRNLIKKTEPVTLAPSCPSIPKVGIPTQEPVSVIIEEKKVPGDICKEAQFESWTATNTRDLSQGHVGSEQSESGCNPLALSVLGFDDTKESNNNVLITFQIEKSPCKTWDISCKLRDTSVDIRKKVREYLLHDNSLGVPTELPLEELELLYKGSFLNFTQTIAEIGIKEGDIIVVRRLTR